MMMNGRGKKNMLAGCWAVLAVLCLMLSVYYSRQEQKRESVRMVRDAMNGTAAKLSGVVRQAMAKPQPTPEPRPYIIIATPHLGTHPGLPGKIDTRLWPLGVLGDGDKLMDVKLCGSGNLIAAVEITVERAEELGESTVRLTETMTPEEATP